MSRRTCPECGRLISSSASHCPGCGYTITSSDHYSWAEQDAKIARKNKFQNIILIIIFGIPIGFILIISIWAMITDQTTTDSKSISKSNDTSTIKSSSNSSVSTSNIDNETTNKNEDFYIPKEDINQILSDYEESVKGNNEQPIEQSAEENLEQEEKNLSWKEKRRFKKQK